MLRSNPAAWPLQPSLHSQLAVHPQDEPKPGTLTGFAIDVDGEGFFLNLNAKDRDNQICRCRAPSSNSRH